MKVLSVNISGAKSIKVGDREVETGHMKEAQNKAVKVNKLGLEGDVQVDTKNHGGKDQAVYIYTKEDYEFWEKELGKSLTAGLFGENLTISGIETFDVRVGDILQIDDLKMEVTAPRIPCDVFAARMGDISFAKKFLKEGRAGFYCRILEEGTVKTGELISMSKVKSGPTITEVSDLWVAKERTKEQLEYILQSPLAERFEARFREYLAKA